MNLVHVRIQLAGHLDRLDWLQQALLSHATPEEAVEHISVHTGDGGALTVGLWITAPSVVGSEQAAYAVVQRALSAESALRHARIISCSSGLVPAAFDQMLQSPQEPGRNVRMTDTATPES